MSDEEVPDYCPVCGWGGPFEPWGNQYDPFGLCPSCGFLSSPQQRLFPLQQVLQWQAAVLYHRLHWVDYGSWWRSPNAPQPEGFHKIKHHHIQTRLQIKYLCPVCGSEDVYPFISDHICRGCGTHFDLNDFPNIEEGWTRDRIWRELRQNWLTTGPTYWFSSEAPQGWTAEAARERLAQWEASGQEFGPQGDWYLERDIHQNRER